MREEGSWGLWSGRRWLAPKEDWLCDLMQTCGASAQIFAAAAVRESLCEFCCLLATWRNGFGYILWPKPCCSTTAIPSLSGMFLPRDDLEFSTGVGAVLRAMLLSFSPGWLAVPAFLLSKSGHLSPCASLAGPKAHGEDLQEGECH